MSNNNLHDLTGAERDIDELLTNTASLTKGGGQPPDGSMAGNLSHRISYLEGGFGNLRWSVGVVSAALLASMAVTLGGMGILLTMMLDLQGSVADLSNRVDRLPSEIRSELIEVNRTLSEAITAARSSEQPQVIVIERSTGSDIYSPDQPLVND